MTSVARRRDLHVSRMQSDFENMLDAETQVGWATTLHLAFQSIGVVYGDMGTSPLYVFSSTFTNGIKDTNDILGVMSLIIYTVVLLPLIKYCFIVLRANDNGDGE